MKYVGTYSINFRRSEKVNHTLHLAIHLLIVLMNIFSWGCPNSDYPKCSESTLKDIALFKFYQYITKRNTDKICCISVHISCRRARCLLPTSYLAWPISLTHCFIFARRRTSKYTSMKVTHQLEPIMSYLATCSVYFMHLAPFIVTFVSFSLRWVILPEITFYFNR